MSKDDKDLSKGTSKSGSGSGSESEDEEIIFFNKTPMSDDGENEGDYWVVLEESSESEKEEDKEGEEDDNDIDGGDDGSVDEDEENNVTFNTNNEDEDEDEMDKSNEPKTPKMESSDDSGDEDEEGDSVVFQANTTEYLEGFEYISYDEDTITRATTTRLLSPTKIESEEEQNDNEKEDVEENKQIIIGDNNEDDESDNYDDDDDEDIVFYNHDYFDEEEDENEDEWRFFSDNSSDDDNESEGENPPEPDKKNEIDTKKEEEEEEEDEENKDEEETSVSWAGFDTNSAMQLEEEPTIDPEESGGSSLSGLFRAARAIKAALRGDQHLVRRERELTYLREYLIACRFADMPGCFYVSGPPGTGKTTAVRGVVAGLSSAAPGNWATVFVDCIQLSKAGPSELFRTIAAQLGLRASGGGGGGQKAVEERLCSRTLPPVAMVVDEADALFSRARRRLLFTIFTFPLLRGSRCIVIAVANASRPPASFWKKLRSRIGIWRVHFGPYSAEDLEAIVNARIDAIPRHDDVIDRVAVHAIAVRLAVTCGDARRMLMLTRAAIDNALGRLTRVGGECNGNDNSNSSGEALVKKADVDAAVDEMLMADARTAGIATLPSHLAILLAVIARKCSIFGVQLDSEGAGGNGGGIRGGGGGVGGGTVHSASGRGGGGGSGSGGWANVGEVMQDTVQAWTQFKTPNAPADSLQDFVLALTLLQQTGLVRIMSESRRGRTPPEMWKVQATIDQETLLSSFKDENASSLILS